MIRQYIPSHIRNKQRKFDIDAPLIVDDDHSVSKRLAISFSGGKTSAVMTKWLLENVPKLNIHIEIEITFANTGCEHEATLEFVRDCDTHFGFNTKWLEAVVTHGERVGIRHKHVTFETASRNGEPFEEAIKKHGIFNIGAPKCTSRLKVEVFDSYLRREVGWKKGSYVSAIGIRADEIDRMSSNAKALNVIYPLIQLGYTKQKVIEEVNSWPFQLNLPDEHYGNCVWCWKKSLRKLLTLAKDSPEVFDFPKRMEAKYSKQNRTFFREHRSAEDILHLAKTTNFVPFNSALPIYDDALDTGSACGESCEIHSDE